MREKDFFSLEGRRTDTIYRESPGKEWKAKEKWREVKKSRQEDEEEQKGRLHQPKEKKRRRARPIGITHFEDKITWIVWKVSQTKERLPLPLGEPKTKLRQEATGCG